MYSKSSDTTKLLYREGKLELKKILDNFQCEKDLYY